MKNVEPLASVYAYLFPEIREVIIKALTPPPIDVLLQSIDPRLDHFHEPVIEAYVTHMSSQIPGLTTFPHRYTAGGSSEALFHILARLRTHEEHTPVYIFEGEYEGYRGYGQNLGMDFRSVPFGANVGDLPKGIFFISNPSARDGNILPDSLIEEVGLYHRIIYDATYVGLTQPHRFTVDHPAVMAVVVSMSKPFGMYYLRQGFCFSREELPTLEVNKWFKNIPSLIVADAALKTLQSSELAKRYRQYQERAVQELSQRIGVPVFASDVVVLAHTSREAMVGKEAGWEKFNRGDMYRFCLSPYFLQFEKEGAKS